MERIVVIQAIVLSEVTVLRVGRNGQIMGFEGKLA